MQAVQEVCKELPDLILIFEELRDKSLPACEDLLQEQIHELAVEHPDLSRECFGKIR
jgi:hypothetical protein